MEQFTQALPLVSIIVPVFNTENYLEQCLSSIKMQLLKNIEVIIIDDGSTDKSANICDRYAKEDDRFIVNHKQNEGVTVHTPISTCIRDLPVGASEGLGPKGQNPDFLKFTY